KKKKPTHPPANTPKISHRPYATRSDISVREMPIPPAGQPTRLPPDDSVQRAAVSTPARTGSTTIRRRVPASSPRWTPAAIASRTLPTAYSERPATIRTLPPWMTTTLTPARANRTGTTRMHAPAAARTISARTGTRSRTCASRDKFTPRVNASPAPSCRACVTSRIRPVPDGPTGTTRIGTPSVASTTSASGARSCRHLPAGAAKSSTGVAVSRRTDTPARRRARTMWMQPPARTASCATATSRSVRRVASLRIMIAGASSTSSASMASKVC
ncbi:AGAP008933-PA, partial [Anopheles gambiae str. PEST]